MKIKKYFLIAILIVTFIILPFPTADLFIRIHFSEPVGETCELYYSTDSANNFQPDQYIKSYIDYEKNQVSFRLDKLLSNNLSGIRLDFNNTDAVICITNITISSGGIIKKQFNPCIFFSPENVAIKNDIADISLAKSRNITYIATSGNDPYIVLDQQLVAQIANLFSNYRLTRFFVCLFFLAIAFMKKQKLFENVNA